MKWSIIRHTFSILFYAFFIWLSINNLRKDPSDNISLYSIVFFAALLGFHIGNLTTEYVAKKKAEAIFKLK